MDALRFAGLLAEVRSGLTAEQCVLLESTVREVMQRRKGEATIVQASMAALSDRRCPHCSHSHVIAHGRDKRGRQRFLCVRGTAGGCGRTFNGLTGTALARMKKPHLWAGYAEALARRDSIARIAATLPITRTTAWRWRHRLLAAAQARDPGQLSGIVEADETFFLRSFKGHRGWQRGSPPEARPPRYRGCGPIGPGLSSQHVPVLTAMDRSGGLIETVLADRTAASLRAALDGRVVADSVLCTDGLAAYRAIAAALACDHRVIRPPGAGRTPWLAAVIGSRPRRRGALGLGRVNGRHSQLKDVINKQIRGVSTRYLGHYLAWLRLLRNRDLDPGTFIEMALARR